MEELFRKPEVATKIQSLFSRGVTIIYEDALKALIEKEYLLERLFQQPKLPEEITRDFLEKMDKETEVIESLKEKVEVVWQYHEDWQPATPESFLNYFLSRYQKLSSILRSRPQLRSAISATSAYRIKGREKISVIGMVKEIRKSKNGKKIVEIEDPTGVATVIVPPDARGFDEIIEDEVIGIIGQGGRSTLFAEEVVYPEVPVGTQWPKGASGKALFISDTHVGSKKFNYEIWERFLEYVNKNKEIKYLFIGGDLVDGIGIYQGQEKELLFDTIEEQYSHFTELFSKVRKDLLMFIIPGNHDATRDAEPQPKIPKKFAESLYKLKNAFVLSNPALVSVEGVKVLMYHGTSLDGVIDAVEPIRATAYMKPTQATRILLKKRHLAPIYGRNRIFPDPEEDYLVIDKVPNVLHTGHVHTADMSTYRGVRLVSSGTFQDRTDFQEKLGHYPTTGKFVEMDLATGKMYFVDFSQEESVSHLLSGEQTNQ